MRRALVWPILFVACHPKPKAGPEDASVAPPTSAVVATVDASAPAPPPEKPLTWGTRPPERGPFFPIVDGVCGGEITALEGKTIYTGSSGFARFEDDGLVLDPNYEKAQKGKEKAWQITEFTTLSGTWPRLVLFSSDHGPGRVRSFESIWVHEEDGWSYFGSSEEKDEPSYAQPVTFKDWLVSSRRGSDPHDHNSDGPTGAALIQAWPMKKDAPPITALASLGRKNFSATSLEYAGDSLYAFGYDQSKSGWSPVVRVLKDGKVTEGANPHAKTAIVGRKDESLFVLGDDGVIRRFDGVKATELPFKLKGGAVIMGAELAPNGDVWALTSKSEIMVLHDGAVTTTSLPAPAEKWPATNGKHGGELGLLAGVAVDDPYAVGETGSLYHLENGEWHEISLPKPPFAQTGKYHAHGVVVASKGDVFVNAGYYEKGIGWKTPVAYRSVLRNKRPKETLRCNEAHSQMRPDIQTIGHGFFSAPPIADETCTTPVVILMRLGTKKDPTYFYDKGFPTLRAAIKETPGLGATAEILEIPWGAVQVVAMKAPDMASAKALAENAAKRVKHEFVETQPEVVCGVPPSIDKKQVVDVATGKFVTTDAN